MSAVDNGDTRLPINQRDTLGDGLAHVSERFGADSWPGRHATTRWHLTMDGIGLPTSQDLR